MNLSRSSTPLPAFLSTNAPSKHSTNLFAPPTAKSLPRNQQSRGEDVRFPLSNDRHLNRQTHPELAPQLIYS
ncbi:hypothetical protein K470DRAFT_259694 [Piedraia hortae CBS 480.64]|uniref:Uncharacterized protein n=1 Tax=Piedraia hortae CBS 480.64 TaxID=1314780 RepID=A0A6A7BTL2_9PEZI|nr:hypothetical protein K470DRAFT_259694 [Piedraia hortae CBS 480.64]